MNALRLLGATVNARIELMEFNVTPRRVPIGASATLTLIVALADGAAEPADEVIDYRGHYHGAKGPKAPKVFKLTRHRLEPTQSQIITRQLRFEHVSIRRIRPGPHTIEVQVNGQVAGSGIVEVFDPIT